MVSPSGFFLCLLDPGPIFGKHDVLACLETESPGGLRLTITTILVEIGTGLTPVPIFGKHLVLVRSET
jgi:hypothetical protein